jgi:hypothetical protein
MYLYFSKYALELPQKRTWTARTYLVKSAEMYVHLMNFYVSAPELPKKFMNCHVSTPELLAHFFNSPISIHETLGHFLNWGVITPELPHKRTWTARIVPS